MPNAGPGLKSQPAWHRPKLSPIPTHPRINPAAGLWAGAVCGAGTSCRAVCEPVMDEWRGKWAEAKSPGLGNTLVAFRQMMLVRVSPHVYNVNNSPTSLCGCKSEVRSYT